MRQQDELLREARKALKEDKEKAELFELLLKHPAWGAFERLLQAQIQVRADEVIAPARSVDELVAREYVKGAMSGLLLALGLPGAIIAAMKTSSGTSDEGDE